MEYKRGENFMEWTLGLKLYVQLICEFFSSILTFISNSLTEKIKTLISEISENKKNNYGR